jgi:hypothetical protein
MLELHAMSDFPQFQWAASSGIAQKAVLQEPQNPLVRDADWAAM